MVAPTAANILRGIFPLLGGFHLRPKKIGRRKKVFDGLGDGIHWSSKKKKKGNVPLYEVIFVSFTIQYYNYSKKCLAVAIFKALPYCNFNN